MTPAPHMPARIAALHDLSCFGRCALTVIIPTLSVMGFQVIPVPTALLSSMGSGAAGSSIGSAAQREQNSSF